MLKKKYMALKRILLFILTIAAINVNASVLDSIRFDVRLGYALGGTVPTHIGNEIRGINSYTQLYRCSRGLLSVRRALGCALRPSV